MRHPTQSIADLKAACDTDCWTAEEIIGWLVDALKGGAKLADLFEAALELLKGN